MFFFPIWLCVTYTTMLTMVVKCAYVYPESPTSILCHGFYVDPILCPDHADHGPTTPTTLLPNLDLPCVCSSVPCGRHGLTVLAFTYQQDLPKFPRCKKNIGFLKIDPFGNNDIKRDFLQHFFNPKRHAVPCGCDQHRNKYSIHYGHYKPKNA